MNLICNLPAEKVWVRREYLRDHQDGHGEFVEGVWVAAKSIPGRAFILRHTYLSMVQCMTICRLVHLYDPPKPQS